VKTFLLCLLALAAGLLVGPGRAVVLNRVRRVRPEDCVLLVRSLTNRY
jgi:hypothetical protein